MCHRGDQDPCRKPGDDGYFLLINEGTVAELLLTTAEKWTRLDEQH